MRRAVEIPEPVPTDRHPRRLAVEERRLARDDLIADDFGTEEMSDMQEAQAECKTLDEVHEGTWQKQPRVCWVTILTRAVYLLGSVGFAMSLCMTVYADRTPDGYIEMPLSGFGALCFGWILMAGLCPAWTANLLLPPTVYYLEAGRLRVAFWYATVAVLLSLTIFLALPPFDRGQVGAIVFEGCWVWIGSIALICLSAMLRLMLAGFAARIHDSV